MRSITAVLTAALVFISCSTPKAPTGDLAKIQLPPGFTITEYVHDVPNARSLCLSPSGTLFISTRTDGRVYAARDTNGDNFADAVYTIASGLRMPNGVAFRNGSLFVAEVSRIIRYDSIEQKLTSPPAPVTVRADFPGEAHHGWKFIGVGPDGKLYVPVGAPCNVCYREDKRYASITRMNTDGTEFEVFAEGVRNTVGFDWHPETHELWFTDNGRDMLGDDLPPDELNRAPKAGLHFGFPYRHGRDIPDPEFGSEATVRQFTPPVEELGAHVAALGMRFYTGSMFPKEYRNSVFIAEHGSWNRSKKTGYRITRVALKDTTAASYEVFAEGWLHNEKAWGRPVDVLVMPDGALLVSDDLAGKVYRISYRQ